MMRRAVALALITMTFAPAGAEDATVAAAQLPTFQGVQIGQPIQKLIYKGGIELSSQSDVFGGLSAIGFTGPDGRLVLVSDRGNFVSGQLINDEAGAPLSLVGVSIEPIQNSKGVDLPN